jgi:hypothetical protein
MKQSILFKVFIVLTGMAAIGGVVVLGLTRSKDVGGETAGPEVTLSETYTHAALA